MATDLHRYALAWLMAAILSPPALAQATAEDTAHPLVDRIWNTRSQRYVSVTEVESQLKDARFILLGEIHDNASHHRFRRDLIAALVRDGRRPAIAMEQFDRDHQTALDRAQNELPRDPERVKNASHFNSKGWNWSFYEPMVRMALDHNLPLLAANMSRADAFRVSTEGAAGVLGTATVDALKLDSPLPDVARRKLEKVIEDGHCGKAPREILPGIVAAQRARDAIMAQTLSRQTATGAVLIAGNGHVRRDFGVPHYLEQYADGSNTVVVGLIEVNGARQTPDDYYTGEYPEYDFIVFTPRTPRPDPCKDIRFKPRQPEQG